MIRNKKRIFAAFLILMLTVAVFFACNKDGGDSVTTTGEAEAESDASFVISADIPSYTAMRSDFADDCISSASTRLRQAMSENLGHELILATDWVKKGEDATPGEYEIILGKANRPEAEAAFSELSENEYIIRAVGKKLVIVGQTDAVTERAVDYFIENYIAGRSTVALADGFEYRGAVEAIRVFDLEIDSGSDYYDKIVTLFALQGIYNREAEDMLYIDRPGTGTDFWLETMQEDGRWLSRYIEKSVGDFEAYLKLVRPYIKKVVIWDPAVPATVNVATTISGADDAVPMTGEQHDKYYEKIFDGLEVIDLRGKFDGSVSGSAKCDAYLWAIENYLEKGLCSLEYMCYYFDSARSREGADISYVCGRDWSTYKRAFVYDLSPWADETPGDDPDQPLGTDHNTYIKMLETQYALTDGKNMTEIAGFFDFHKYSQTGGKRHGEVETEWETVRIITPYNCYQNTTVEFSYNQSVHSQCEIERYTQNDKPAERELENKTYISFLMADYDAVFPIYFKQINFWNDENRGKVPLNWGMNPNLADHYPDLFEYFYSTRTENDFFVADASAAGYFNPTLIKDEHWDMVTAHNKKYYDKLDMSISPMILDWSQLTERVKDEFKKFSPDGIAAIISGDTQERHMWDGMPVDNLFNGFYTNAPESAAATVKQALRYKNNQKEPQLLLVRAVWVSPTFIYETVEALKESCPKLDIECVDMYTYFDLLEKSMK